MQEPAALERAEIGGVEAERDPKLGRVMRQPLAMPVGRRVARFDGGAKAENHRLRRFEFVGVALQAHERLDARVQLHWIERLVEKFVAPGFDPAQTIGAVRLCRHDHDRDEPRGRLLFELAAHFETMAARRDEIDQHEVRRVGGANLEHPFRRLNN